MNTKLVTHIKSFLEEKKMSPAMLEKQAGLKINAVWNILYGRSKNPKISTIKAIADVIGCSINDLLTYKDNLSNNKVNLPNLSVKEEISHKSLNKDLLSNTTKIVLECLESLNNLHLNLKQAQAIIEHAYNFSNRTENNNKADRQFVEWIIEQNFPK